LRLLPPLLLAAALEAPQPGAPGAARPPSPIPAAPACDGKPPEVRNQDAVPHAFTLTCGRKVTERTVAPGETQVLEGFSGCTFTLAGRAETLHTEMICTVRTGGAFTCDLL